MIKMKKRAFILTLAGVILATLLAGLGGFYIFTQVKDVKIIRADTYDTLSDISEKYGKLYTMQKTIEDQFLWQVDEEKQMDALYKALAGSLGDKYSVYMNTEETKEWNRYVTGVFTGIGITFIETENGDFLITGVMDGGPADIGGLEEGDIIRKVDGREFSDSDRVAAALQGEKGSQVKVTYERKKKTRTVSLVRSEVEEPSVYAGLLDSGYGYIQITGFEKTTAEQFATELAGFENKKVPGIVIDLRGNPGGLMDQSIEIADLLLPECNIMHTEDKEGKKEYYNSDEKCTGLPYVLLIDEKSASAAEILAAAVKDNRGGSLVGVKTFGKGIVQSQMEFSDHSSLKLTTMQYFSPKNHKIHKKGVTPDYTVKQTEGSRQDRQLKKAVYLLSGETGR